MAQDASLKERAIGIHQAVIQGYSGDQGAVHPMTGTVLMLFFGLPVMTRSL